MIIKNKESLATTEQRRQALEIIEAAIKSVMPGAILRSTVAFDAVSRTLTVRGDSYDVSRGRVFVVGGGKASGLMAAEIEKIICPENITAGIVAAKSESDRAATENIKVITAGHPIPDSAGAGAVSEMLFLKDAYSIGKDDLVLCLISGGGSALLPGPAEGITLADKQQVTGMLLGSGADITEINTVRKHLSRIKGGRLGRIYAPATVVSLILSDVIGNDLSVIASGPTYPDPTTFAQALGILDKYRVTPAVPDNVIGLLKRGLKGQGEETPDRLDNCFNYIIGDNALALDAMSRKAAEFGLKPHIITAEQKGDTGTAAEERAAEITDGKYDTCDALIIGGETTPTLPNNPGLGGRNQHYAAVTLLAMAGFPGEWTAASAGTDGSDYLPDVAGAIVDRSSAEAAAKKDLDVADYIRRFDSNTLFKEIGSSLIKTGDTGTNVGDVMIYLLRK